jgi:hypothetical protein
LERRAEGRGVNVHQPLTRYDAARRALAEAVRIDEVKDIIDRAAAFEEYARRAKDTEMLDNATELRLNAERKGGEILIEMAENGERADRGRRDQMSRATTFTLKDLEVSRDQSSKWQRLAKLPEDKFKIRVDHAKARVKGMTTSAPSYPKAEYTGENEWFTPEPWLLPVRKTMGGIDLDPASHDLAQERVQAKAYFTAADNGLEQAWWGRVWLNPPYCRALLGPFVAKLVAEHARGAVTQAILLTHNYTDTDWFHTAAGAARAICFPRGRIHFVAPSGEECSPTQGQAFFYFGVDDEAFRGAFGELGLVVRPA